MGSVGIGGHHPGGKEGASYVSTNFFVGLFAGEVELVAPPNRVLGDHGFQRAVLRGSREECYAEAIMAYKNPEHNSAKQSVNLLGDGDHPVRMP